MKPLSFYQLNLAAKTALLQQATLVITTTGGWKEGYFFALYKLDGFFVPAISQDEQAFAEGRFLQLIAQEFWTVLDQITGGSHTSIKPEHHG